jgi:hypothetical protein
LDSGLDLLARFGRRFGFVDLALELGLDLLARFGRRFGFVGLGLELSLDLFFHLYKSQK